MRSGVARTVASTTAGLAVAALLFIDAPMGVIAARTGLRAAVADARPAAELDDGADDGDFDRSLAVPTGAPTAIGCDDARRVVAQARTGIASPVGPVDPAKFAEAAADWLDPHGLWSVAPDSPVSLRIKADAARVLAELEAPPESGPCAASEEIAAELQDWTTKLRALFDEGFREGAESPALAPGSTEAFKLATGAPFEEGAVTRSAHELARELGHQAGALRHAYGGPIAPFTEATRERVAPSLDRATWTRVVIAAALRAYVPQLDAHGAWAPLEEELSIYDLGLETNPPERLWSEMTRTVLGVRIDRGAMAPLEEGDLVLRAHDVPLAGVSVEQAEQFAVLESRDAPAHITVLREGELEPIDVVVTPGNPGRAGSGATAWLRSDVVKYADGKAVVITIPDVPDDLATKVSNALETARKQGDLRGVVLDVRANGGGSTDGAIGTLGIFLPGASLFPMRRRDGGIEVERAPDVPADHRWSGPLAVVVDGDSASAAEMIAGAIASYHRGVVVGDKTYGKGCAQEYLDDDAHVGVLRLTTLLYALPDGSPVQKVGISPHVHLSLPVATEREAMMTRALGPWRGPDVRDPTMVRDVLWPNHGGRVGPCRDDTVCRALRALGAQPAAAR